MKVFIIAAISADGYIAKGANDLADWTSAEDKKLFVKLTKQAGVMVMGATTLATIGRALPGRRTIVYTTHPEDINIDGVEPTAEDPKLLLDRLEKTGANAVAICGGRSIYTLFMRENLVDEIYLTVEPTVFGAGIGLFSAGLDAKLSLIESTKLNKDAVLLHYQVIHE